MADRMTVAVLTVSDRCAAGQAVDASGPAVADFVARHLHADVLHSRCIPDEQEQIAQQLVQWAASDPVPDLILTTGGTGFSPRDVTPEATLSVVHRQANNLMELARMRCYQKTPLAYLSRGVAGVLHHTLIVNLPGSPKGAVETIAALADVLPHAVAVLRGHGAGGHASD